MTYPTTLAAITALIEARNAGDVEAALTCYEKNATVVAQPGLVLSGLDGARAALEGFVAMKPVFSVGSREIIEGDSVSLHLMQWRLQGTGPDGQALDVSGRTADVFRRQPDGGWLLAVDNPYGTDLLTAAGAVAPGTVSTPEAGPGGRAGNWSAARGSSRPAS